ncbi:MAG: hypothetical protein MUF60_08380 [Vicinamibacterales bacterium]|nr:hypothetical protein [Vicinamibacterales bacterium]
MSGWRLVYEGFAPEAEGLREALCTLGNGFFATRGAAPECEADGTHYPGTYLAGGYNRLVTQVSGHAVEHEDLVNLPNWLPLTCRVAGGEWFHPRRFELRSCRQELDLRAGLLTRSLEFVDPGGRRTRLVHRRLVHMLHPHLAAQETTIVAENWSGRLEVRTALDGRVANAGVARYRSLDGRHLDVVAAEPLGDDGLFLEVQTTQSRLRVSEAARVQVLRGGAVEDVERRLERDGAWLGQVLGVDVAEGEPVCVDKVLALFTSRDRGVSDCALDAREALARAPGFDALLETHRRAWEHLWRRFDVEIEAAEPGTAEPRVPMALRLHVFHLLQTISPHSVDLDVGVPARGWHGEAYRGHVFWDELFIFPFLNFRLPKITRALLAYRHRRLDQARWAAREAGFDGAMYPWQSGSNGREESQRFHLNPRSGRWLADHTHLQRHVSAAIAHNVWRYVEVTNDTEFLQFHGAEMILEIARFWASLATFDPRTGRYEIRGVMGPDEYHDGYPGADTAGVHNNAYTNVMAVAVLGHALEALALLPEDRRRELCDQLAIDGPTTRRWDDITRRMRVVFHHDGIISQFEGYEDLLEVDWDAYRRRYGDIHRLDRILEAEGDTPNRYKVSKQADVLMLFYLFSAEELIALFTRLGYAFDPSTIPRTIDYYTRRTCHGSTLSRVVHSWVLARSDRAGAWRLFTEAAMSDLLDVQQGTTAEGIHLGAMAGTLDFVQRGITGLVTSGDTLRFNPCLPDALASLRLQLRYRGQSLGVEITRDTFTLTVLASHEAPITVEVGGVTHVVSGGDRLELATRP